MLSLIGTNGPCESSLPARLASPCLALPCLALPGAIRREEKEEIQSSSSCFLSQPSSSAHAYTYNIHSLSSYVYTATGSRTDISARFIVFCPPFMATKVFFFPFLLERA